MFTEAEPEEQAESTTCSFPALLFAACPHTRVNKQLIETPNTPLFPSRPRFISSFVYKPSAVRRKRSERAMQNVLFSCSDRENEVTSEKDNAGKILFHSVNNCIEKADVIISTKGHKHVSLHSRKQALTAVAFLECEIKKKDQRRRLQATFMFNNLGLCEWELWGGRGGGVKCRYSRVIIKQQRPVGQRFHFLTELSEILNHLFTVVVGGKQREWILFLYSALQ